MDLRTIPLASVLLGAVAGVAVVGMNLATAQLPNRPLDPPLDGWMVQVKTSQPGAMDFVVSVKNTETAARPIRLDAKLVQMEFKGNPMSRVLLPKDTVETVLETQTLTGTVGGGSTKALDVHFKTAPRAVERAKLGIQPISYAVVIEREGKVIARAAVSPARNAP